MRKYLLTQFFVKKFFNRKTAAEKLGVWKKISPLACSRLVLKSKDWGLRQVCRFFYPVMA